MKNEEHIKVDVPTNLKRGELKYMKFGSSTKLYRSSG